MIPEFFHAAWLRLKALAHQRRLEEDLEEELAFHRAMQEERNRAEGLPAEEAVYAAGRQFGNSTAIRERCRDEWRFTALEGIWTDIR
jgi:hypothetical protein